MINQLLIQLIIIFFPIFIQQFYFSRIKATNKLRHHVLNGAMFGGSAVLCMTFPINVVESFQWDLRSVPIIISVLYNAGKYTPGIVASVIAILYRLYIGGDAAIISTIGFLFFVGPSFFFVKAFQNYRSIKRVIFSLILAVNSFFFILILLLIYIKTNVYVLELPTGGLIHFALICTVSIIGMGISSLLNEHIIESRMMKLELERSEKLKIVSQIAASVAHEVRNPLTVVKGFLQLLKESVDDKKKNYLKIALSELDRAEFIITDYLNLAKPQPDQLEVIEVSGFLNNTIEMMNSYGLIQNVQIQLNCKQTGLYVLADKPRLSQVVLNLIKNGVEAIPDTGDVTVNAFEMDEVIVLEIIDTGKGMSKEDLSHMGTPFFTTKDNGTGLGILVTIRIVEAMKGKISFESELGKGTKVMIKLPSVRHVVE
ncbi:MAG: ATP-binding protein [Bacillota bacterium]